MGKRLNAFLDNDSTFGRIMGRLAVMIGANLMFVVFSLPVITIGPGLAALFYVMLKTLHTNDYPNPFKTFWKGFVMNLKQGILCTVLFALIAVILVLDIRFCDYQGGILTVFKYACYALLFLLVIEAVYLQPVMAAFSDTIPHLLRNAFFFAARKPLKMLLAVALFAVPVAVTILDTYYRPLYAFIWVTIGFGLITMLISELLYKDIAEFLPTEEDTEETTRAETPKLSQRKILKEMKKLE